MRRGLSILCVLVALVATSAVADARKFRSSKKFSEYVPTVNDVIDVVYTWVNGTDPNWLSLHREWLQKEAVKAGVSAKQFEDQVDEKPKLFFTNDELRYSLRSLYHHALSPAASHADVKIGTIFIVTNHQSPPWLNVSHPKIKLVSHESIFPKASDLPTFSTFAIEANLHRIPGLSKHYLYLNDDFFLGRTLMRSSLIEEARDAVKYRMSKYNAADPSWRQSFKPWIRGQSMCVELLNKKFSQSASKGVRWAAGHAPLLFNKNLVEQMVADFPEAFAQTSSHRFRGMGKNVVIYFMYTQYSMERRLMNIDQIVGVGKESFEEADFTEFISNGRKFSDTYSSVIGVLDNISQAVFFNINKLNHYSPAVVFWMQKQYPEMAPWETFDAPSIEVPSDN